MKQIKISGPDGDITLGNNAAFVLFAGPCQIENRDHTLRLAELLKKQTDKLNIPLVFKASFDKANRTSAQTPRGVGIDEGLRILADIRENTGLAILTDVHEPSQCAKVAQVADILQIPAFLCRQTDLLLAAAATGKVVNIKKGQFLAPWDMANVAAKVKNAGNDQIILTERGTSFGYNTLVSDYRGIPVMAQTGYPVVFDATHSVQQPGGRGNSSGGQREFVPVLARAALAVGVSGLFVESHDNPVAAPSDGPNMLPIDMLPELLPRWQALDYLTKFS